MEPAPLGATHEAIPYGTVRQGPDVLSHDDFVLEIEREKRRAERARAPFSMVTFAHATGIAADDVLDRLPDVVAKMKRDTDVMGHLDNAGLAVLLPQTDVEGAKRFVEKVVVLDEVTGVTTSIVTYPDHVFDSLTVEAPTRRRPTSIPTSRSRITGRHLVKRTMDVGGALIGIALLSPLMLLTAIAVATTSPGPVIFRQTRLGRGAKSFVLYKFRSMFRDADERVHRDYVLGLIEGGKQGGSLKRAWAKLEGDDRVTPVGRFIRRTCLDELPQLFNVIKGDLSLVGPRPPLPYEAAAYEFWHLRRVLEIKPGVTGLWQVEGRNITTFDDMVRLDLRYVRTWSIRLDLRILLKTAAIVLKRSSVG